MKTTGILIGTLGVKTGAAALVLYGLNLAVWSVLAALLGGGMALIGLGLILWALYPLRGSTEDASQSPDMADDTEAQPA